MEYHYIIAVLYLIIIMAYVMMFILYLTVIR